MDPVGGNGEMDETARAPTLDGVGQLVDLRSARPGQARGDDSLDPPAGGEGLVEDPEAGRGAARRIAEGGGEVDELHREAQVGLVRPEPLERLLVREARERNLQERTVWGDGSGDLDRHRLHEAHDRLLGRRSSSRGRAG